MNMSRWYLTIVIIGVIVTVGGGTYMMLENTERENQNALAQPQPQQQQQQTASVSFGTTTLQVVVADTPQARRQGLSGRDTIPEDGMLFVFEESARHGFWMKDMRFPIDIIWLDQDGQVVDVKKRVTPDSYPDTFKPDTPARYVVEVEAGLYETFQLEIGDNIQISGIDQESP